MIVTSPTLLAIWTWQQMKLRASDPVFVELVTHEEVGATVKSVVERDGFDLLITGMVASAATTIGFVLFFLRQPEQSRDAAQRSA